MRVVVATVFIILHRSMVIAIVLSEVMALPMRFGASNKMTVLISNECYARLRTVIVGKHRNGAGHRENEGQNSVFH